MCAHRQYDHDSHSFEHATFCQLSPEGALFQPIETSGLAREATTKGHPSIAPANLGETLLAPCVWVGHFFPFGEGYADVCI